MLLKHHVGDQYNFGNSIQTAFLNDHIQADLFLSKEMGESAILPDDR